ncbi:MAG: DUF748 domain-containing protein [Syntrophobacteraceae bacterium]
MKQSALRILSSRYLLIPPAILLLYTILGFLVAPMALRWYLPKLSKAHINSQAEIGKVSINPYLLTVDGRDFSLKGPDGELLANMERLFLRLNIGGLFEGTAKFAEFILENPGIHLVIGQDGGLNLAKLVPETPEKPVPDNSKSTSTDPVKLILESLTVTGGKIDITDRRQSSPVSLEITDIALDLKALSTIRNQNGTYSFQARTDEGESVQWQGDICLFPFQSKGTLTCSGIQAKTAWEFQQHSLNLDAPGGKLSLSTDYHIDLSAPSLQLVLENLRMDLADFSLKLSGSEEVFLELNKLDLESAKFDLASMTVQIGSILLDGGKLRLQIDESGRMNVAQLVRHRVQKEKEKAPVPEVVDAQQSRTESRAWTASIDSIEIKNIAFGVEDHTRSEPLSADISSISVRTKAKIEAGRSTQVQLSEGFVELAGLRLANKKAPDPIFDARRLIFENCALDLTSRSIMVSLIQLTGGHLDTGLQQDGKLNLESIFAAKMSRAPDAEVAKPRPDSKSAWKFLVKAFELKDFRSALSDYRITDKPLYNIKELNARITEIDGKSPMGFEVGFGMEQGGKLALEGKVDPAAQSVEAKVTAGELVLTPLAPYLAPYITLALQSAVLSAEGNLRYGIPKSGAKLAYEGKLSINKFSLTQPGSKETYLGWGAMQLPKLKMALEPNSLQVEEIQLSKPVGELIIAEDGTINLSKIMRDQTAGKTSSAPSKVPSRESAKKPAPAQKQHEKSGDAFPFKINTVRIDEGNVIFADLSLLPKFMTRIHHLKGTITRLSSEKGALSKIQLTGGVDQYGMAKADGTLDLSDYRRSTELNLIFRNVEMASITPYSGKFAGRKIKSGKLSTDLKYQIRDNKLAGDNKIIVENLVLGEKVDSPDAVNLPLDLAVALLADSNGRIDLGLPVTGDLNDPQFSIAPLIWKAFTNIITKAVTAPFRALAGLFGGGEQKLDSIQFDPGKAELMPPENEKLKKVAEGLKAKSQLMVVVQGRYSAEADGIQLKELNLRREVNGRLGNKPAPGTDPEPLDFSNSNVRKALEKVFEDRFGEKALDDVSRAVEKGEIRPRDIKAEAAERKKTKKGGVFSRALTAAKVDKIIPGMKSPAESELLAGELYYRLVESAPLPEEELKQLASQRGQAISAEIQRAGQIQNTRVQTAAPESQPGDEGLSAKLSLEPQAVTTSEPLRPQP